MLTISDIKKLKAVFATKQDLAKQGTKFLSVFATKQDLRQIRDEMVTKKEFNEKFDGVLDKLDTVLGEVKDIRQEQTVHLRGAHDRIEEEIIGIKRRLDKVEAVVNP